MELNKNTVVNAMTVAGYWGTCAMLGVLSGLTARACGTKLGRGFTFVCTVAGGWTLANAALPCIKDGAEVAVDSCISVGESIKNLIKVEHVENTAEEEA